MNLDGVTNAKYESFKKVFDFAEVAAPQSVCGGEPSFLPLPDTSAFAAMFKRNEREPDPRQEIALGVYRPKSGHERDHAGLRLGVFVQRKKLEKHPLVEDIVKLSKGECKVIYTGPVGRRAAAATNAGVARPLRIGCSLAHYRVTAGTLAAFAVNRTGGGVGLLSNNHVLANTNQARYGDPILQPSKWDGGDRENDAHRVATLQKFHPINFEPGSVNFVDCAFAYMREGIERDTAKLFVDPANPALSRTLQLPMRGLEAGDSVKKIGRTTGLTYGLVDSTTVDNLFVNMMFGTSKPIARFDRVIALVGLERAFSQPGDSGSLILTEDNAPAALLFAGSKGGDAAGGTTFANPIGEVCDALDIDLYVGP